MRRVERAAACLALAGALLGAGCDTARVLAVADPVGGGAEVAFGNGLLQSVTVRPTALLDAHDIEVRSVILNASRGIITVTARTCSLDFGGSLAIEEIPTIARCTGYSVRQSLFPGDSIVMSDLRRVGSPRGEYVLRVRHALQPELWVPVPVTVR